MVVLSISPLTVVKKKSLFCLIFFGMNSAPDYLFTMTVVYISYHEYDYFPSLT